MYAVVVAIDWFIDRFRTALNVSSDIFAAKIVSKVLGGRPTQATTRETVTIAYTYYARRWRR